MSLPVTFVFPYFPTQETIMLDVTFSILISIFAIAEIVSPLTNSVKLSDVDLSLNGWKCSFPI